MSGKRRRPLLIITAFVVLIVFGYLLLRHRASSLNQTELERAKHLLQNPMPELGFINVLPAQGYVGPYVDKLCVDVLVGEPLVTGPNQDDYVISHTQASLDDSVLFTMSPPMDSILAGYRIDENGTQVDWSGPLEFCYAIDPGLGDHLATIQIQAYSGRTYSYTWAFVTTS